MFFMSTVSRMNRRNTRFLVRCLSIKKKKLTCVFPPSAVEAQLHSSQWYKSTRLFVAAVHSLIVQLILVGLLRVVHDSSSGELPSVGPRMFSLTYLTGFMTSFEFSSQSRPSQSCR